ncbi:DUF3152 domain-containing protein [Nocardia abscessus]|uniref:DUF3152 domain-containing protein n=1 Tax=Nocardia abscessus TaxID=120957 RepID=A0ABS0CCV1_9NOCA|nr:DUF3152 domain-containing protein [Nocardia abscessus]
MARTWPEARSDGAARTGAAKRSGAGGGSPGRGTSKRKRVEASEDTAPPAVSDQKPERDGVEVYDPLGLYSHKADRSHQPLRARWDPTAPAEGRARGRPERDAKKQSALGRFVSTYGWRAYALPVLVVITVLVVVDAIRATDPSSVVGPDPGLGRLSSATATAGVIGAPPGDGHFPTDLPAGALPEGGAFAETGGGAWHVVPGTTAQVGTGTGTVFRYTVEIENGVDTSGLGGDEAVAKMIDSTLANPKSWVHDPRFAFRRVDQGDADFRISLTSRGSSRKECGFDIPIDTSCYNAASRRVVLSEVRWVRGALAFEGDIGSYRQYLINHEVGHAIGYHQHQACETDGGLAPVMMQQTFGTENNDIAALDPHGVVPMDGKHCRFNPWPYPRG